MVKQECVVLTTNSVGDAAAGAHGIDEPSGRYARPCDFCKSVDTSPADLSAATPKVVKKGGKPKNLRPAEPAFFNEETNLAK